MQEITNHRIKETLRRYARARCLPVKYLERYQGESRIFNLMFSDRTGDVFLGKVSIDYWESENYLAVRDWFPEDGSRRLIWDEYQEHWWIY